jgi:hypothetical protein
MRHVSGNLDMSNQIQKKKHKDTQHCFDQQRPHNKSFSNRHTNKIPRQYTITNHQATVFAP